VIGDNISAFNKRKFLEPFVDNKKWPDAKGAAVVARKFTQDLLISEAEKKKWSKAVEEARAASRGSVSPPGQGRLNRCKSADCLMKIGLIRKRYPLLIVSDLSYKAA
jgi:hypothetical protein